MSNDGILSFEDADDDGDDLGIRVQSDTQASTEYVLALVHGLVVSRNDRPRRLKGCSDSMCVQTAGQDIPRGG